MNNYALDTPIKKKLYEITEKDIPFAPAYQPKAPSETDQSHRNMIWLHHNPRELAGVAIATESGRDKKK